MHADEFEARLAKVRHRFSGTLESKINDTITAFPNLSIGAPDATAAVDEVYRRIHSICGVASTVGFPGSGKAAREAEVVLLAPMRDKRGLTPAESTIFKTTLDALWKASQSELQLMYGRGG
jgi:chemotaxis protein histidine kinase CheA